MFLNYLKNSNFLSLDDSGLWLAGSHGSIFFASIKLYCKWRQQLLGWLNHQQQLEEGSCWSDKHLQSHSLYAIRSCSLTTRDLGQNLLTNQNLIHCRVIMFCNADCWLELGGEIYLYYKLHLISLNEDYFMKKYLQLLKC